MKGISCCSKTTRVVVVIGSISVGQVFYLERQVKYMQDYSPALQHSVQTVISTAVGSNNGTNPFARQFELQLIENQIDHDSISGLRVIETNDSAGWIENQAHFEPPINSVDSYYLSRMSHGDHGATSEVTNNNVMRRKKWHLDVKNYFQATNTDGTFHLVASKLAPIQLAQKYIATNSQQELDKLYNKCGTNCFHQRSFLVGHYSCPLEAGNRMFQFMNTFLWALLTDRVFLWRYLDERVCELEGAGDPAENRTCDNTTLNTMQDCSNILHLSDWVPPWEEWKQKLNLTDPVRAYVIGNGLHDEQYKPLDMDENPRVLHVGPAKNLETGMKLSRNPRARPQRALMSKSSTRNNARQLFAQKMFFAYGMMFEALFTLDDSLLPQPPSTSDATTSTSSSTTTTTTTVVHSFALHSRHSKEKNDGRDIMMEVSCMDRILRPRAHAAAGVAPCIVYVMTDRQSTKDLLASALKSSAYNCTAIFTNNITSGTSFRTEHGPFAGRGYFEDLVLVIQARHGFIAPGTARRIQMQGIRTSSGLPRSIIEFRRTLESMVSSFHETTNSSRSSSDFDNTAAMELSLPQFEECFS